MEFPDSMEYWFGDGTGPASSWRSPAYGGLTPLDFDGDGRADDLLLDLDGDGRADVAALDLDDDGIAEAWFTDDGAGTWPVPMTPRCVSGAGAPAAPHPAPAPSGAAPSGDGPEAPVIVWTPAEGDAGARQAFVDTDGDGAVDTVLFDADGDGRADGAVTVTPAATPSPAKPPGQDPDRPAGR